MLDSDSDMDSDSDDDGDKKKAAEVKHVICEAGWMVGWLAGGRGYCRVLCTICVPLTFNVFSVVFITAH